MDGKQIEVVENNEHLGQIVSGVKQEEKNVDLRISKARKALFGLLGPAFSYSCLLSPILKLHLYKTFVCPVLRSGLSSFVLKNTSINPLSVFQRKTLRGLLNLSKQASTAAIHFLTGELPIEAKIHKDIFSLFYSIWTNPNTKVYTVVKYLLSVSSDKSRTWSNFVRHLCKQYGLDDPLNWLNSEPPTKTSFKTNINSRIHAFHEHELRNNTSNIVS